MRLMNSKVQNTNCSVQGTTLTTEGLREIFEFVDREDSMLFEF